MKKRILHEKSNRGIRRLVASTCPTICSLVAERAYLCPCTVVPLMPSQVNSSTGLVEP